MVMGGLLAGGMSGSGVGSLIGLCLAVMTLINHQIHQITLDKLFLGFVAYTAIGAFLGNYLGVPLGLLMALVTRLSPARHGRAVSCMTVFLWGMVACMFGSQYGALAVADPQNASAIWYWIGPIVGAIAVG